MGKEKLGEVGIQVHHQTTPKWTLDDPPCISVQILEANLFTFNLCSLTAVINGESRFFTWQFSGTHEQMMYWWLDSCVGSVWRVLILVRRSPPQSSVCVSRNNSHTKAEIHAQITDVCERRDTQTRRKQCRRPKSKKVKTVPKCSKIEIQQKWISLCTARAETNNDDDPQCERFPKLHPQDSQAIWTCFLNLYIHCTFSCSGERRAKAVASGEVQHWEVHQEPPCLVCVRGTGIKNNFYRCRTSVFLLFLMLCGMVTLVLYFTLNLWDP